MSELGLKYATHTVAEKSQENAGCCYIDCSGVRVQLAY